VVSVWGTVPSIPATGSIVTAWVTLPIVIILTAVSIILWPADRLGPLTLTVPAIVQTGLIVTGRVTDTVLEYLSTGLSIRGGIAALPGVHTEVAVTFVKLAGKLVTLRVALPVAGLGVAVVEPAVPLLLLIVQHQVLPRMTRGRGDVNTTRRRFVINITVLPLKLDLAVAVIIPWLVNTPPILPTRVIHALIPVINLAVPPRGPLYTLTPVPRPVSQAGTTIIARVEGTPTVTVVAALWARVPLRAGAHKP